MAESVHREGFHHAHCNARKWQWWSSTAQRTASFFLYRYASKSHGPSLTFCLSVKSQAETFKYLYLLFADDSDIPVNIDDYIFTTEAHPLPLNLASMHAELVSRERQRVPRP